MALLVGQGAIGAIAGVFAAVLVGVLGFEEAGAFDGLAAGGIWDTRLTNPTDAAVVHRAFVPILTGRLFGGVGVAARALVADVQGTDVGVVAVEVGGAFAHAGLSRQITRSLLAAIQVDGAFNADQGLGAFAAGTVGVVVALDAGVRGWVALGAAAVIVLEAGHADPQRRMTHPNRAHNPAGRGPTIIPHAVRKGGVSPNVRRIRRAFHGRTTPKED